MWIVLALLLLMAPLAEATETFNCKFVLGNSQSLNDNLVKLDAILYALGAAACVPTTTSSTATTSTSSTTSTTT